MNQLRRLRGVFVRLVQGKDVVAVRLTKEEWDRQFAKGKWNYLVHGTPNAGLIVWRIQRYALERATNETFTLLDVGCGNGALPFFLAKTDARFTYYGTDISGTALEEARRLHPSGTFECIGMEQAPAVPHPVDVLVFNEVLLYADHVRTLVAHRPLLAPQGTVIISLYRTLRTRFIWWQLQKLLTFDEHYTVTDAGRGVTWDVRVCSFR